MSNVSDYGQPKGRSTAVAVVLATVFLTLLGAMVGVILGTTQKNGPGSNVANHSPSPTAPSPAVTETVTTPATPDGNGGGGATKPASPKTYRPTSKDTCPQQTSEAAHTDLSVKLSIRTANSEVWICQGGGRYFYQGHIRGKPFQGANSNTSLFIPDPHYEAGVWAATNGSTTYFVSTDRLRREKDGHEEANDPVEDYYNG